MQALATVLLRHDTPAGSHFDWLLEDPLAARSADARLHAWRVTIPSSAWASSVRWALEPIAPHRRIYLTYQGPIAPERPGGPGRGSVARVDQGRFVARLWSPGRKILDLHMQAFVGRVEIVALGPGGDQARLLNGGEDQGLAPA